MTVGNGAIGGNGCTQLVYTIEDVKRDEVFQSEDIVALGDGEDVALKTVFFSDQGVSSLPSSCLFQVPRGSANISSLGPLYL